MSGAQTDPDHLALPLQWRGPDAERLRFEPLDGLMLVYDRASGQTHLLAPPLPELLECLAIGPATTLEIVDRLTALFDLDQGDPAPIIAERLAELGAMGLVEAR